MEPFPTTQRCGPRGFSSAKTISPPTMVISWFCLHQWPERLPATAATCDLMRSLCAVLKLPRGLWSGQSSRKPERPDCGDRCPQITIVYLQMMTRSMPDHDWIKALPLIEGPTSAHGKFEDYIQLFHIWCFILIFWDKSELMAHPGSDQWALIRNNFGQE